MFIERFRYDNICHRDREYADDQRLVPLAQEIYWTEESNQGIKGTYLISINTSVSF